MALPREKSKILTYHQPGEFYGKLAIRNLDRDDLPGAMANLRRALNREPGNREYQLLLADVLSRLQMYDRSCRILYGLLEEGGDEAAECAYYLGYNQMNMGQYDKALRFLRGYLDAEPEGEYAEDAEDMILSIYEYLEDMEQLTPAEKLAEEGREAMDQGDYSRAAERFSRCLEQDDSLVYARNNLSICQYALGDVEGALRDVEQVRAVEPQNIFANCNLLLYYQTLRDVERSIEQLEEIEKLVPQNEQDALRLGLALGENHRDAAAYEVFRSAMNQFEWDERMLYFAGIAAYNSGQYGRAFRHFGELSKWEWENSISLYYRNLAQEAMKEEPQVLWLAYQYQVPLTEAARRVSVINGVLRKGPRATRSAFLEDAEFRSYALWGVELSDKRVRSACIEILSMVATQECILTLRWMLLSEFYDDETKNELLMALYHAGEPEPYLAMLEGSVVRAKISVYDFPKDGEAFYREVIALAVSRMGEEGQDALVDEMVAVFCEYIRDHGMEETTGMKKEDLCAALAYLAALRRGKPLLKKEACRIFGVRYDGLNRGLGALGYGKEHH